MSLVDKIMYTKRGFWFVSFADMNGEESTVQQSSLATENCLWVGIRESKNGIRGHLTEEQWSIFLGELNKFVNGEKIEPTQFRDRYRSIFEICPEKSDTLKYGVKVSGIDPEEIFRISRYTVINKEMAKELIELFEHIIRKGELV